MRVRQDWFFRQTEPSCKFLTLPQRGSNQVGNNAGLSLCVPARLLALACGCQAGAVMDSALTSRTHSAHCSGSGTVPRSQISSCDSGIGLASRGGHHAQSVK
jgi:hypothetical protein